MSVGQLVATRRQRMVAIVLALAAVVGVSLLVRHRLAALPDDAVLRYGDHVVTEADFKERVDVLNALYGISRPEDGDRRDTFNRDMAKSIAVSLILDQAAKDEDIVISEKSARDTLTEMAEAQLGPDPQQAFQQLLTKFGVSEDDILEEVSRQQAIARLFKTVTQNAVDSVTPEDAKARYVAAPDAFAIPEKRQIANIVVASRKEALAILSSARKGASFASLARKKSLDGATREQGGVLGEVTASDLETAYAQAAFAAGSGETFGPVETTYGWNVGKVLRVIPARQQSFDKVQEDAIDVVRSERAMKAWRDWLAQELKAADVDYADNYLPENPDQPPAEVAGAGEVAR